MRTFALDEAPSDLSEVGRRRWLSGVPGDPAPGDIWLLSWDARVLAVVMIALARSDYISCWPVTLPGEPSVPPALMVPDSPLDSPVVIWPAVQTGVGRHLLHRRLGQLMTQQSVRAIQSARSTNELPFERVGNPASDTTNFTSDMLQWFQALCFHEWPDAAAGDVVLNTAFISAQQMGVADVREALDVTTQRAGALLRQEISPTADELSRMANRWGSSVDELVIAPSDDITRELLRPEYKDDILTIAADRHLDERTARRLTRAEVALAARSDGRVASRVSAAIDRLKDGPDAPVD